MDIPLIASNQRRTKARWLQASQFALVSLVGLGINALVREIVSFIFYPIWMAIFPNPMVAEVVNYNFSIIAAIGVVLELRGQPAVDVSEPLGTWHDAATRRGRLSTTRRQCANRPALAALSADRCRR